jgi:serine phosphatase RsbU (regulator of sigma subunit)
MDLEAAVNNNKEQIEKIEKQKQELISKLDELKNKEIEINSKNTMIQNQFSEIIKKDSNLQNLNLSTLIQKNRLDQTKKEIEKQSSIMQGQEKKIQDQLGILSKQKNIIILFAALSGIILFFAGLTFYNFRQKKKQADQLKLQKEEIASRNHLIEEKNKEITDSMNYARRIQSSLMNSEYILAKDFKEFFILYKPKDIVSGDFYWSTKEGNIVYTIVADCTGHGVPGAFMSLLCMSLLNESIHNSSINSPDLVLNHVRKKLIEILNPAGIDSERKDGMDCILCAYDTQNRKLSFACANNPLWYFSNDEFSEFKADKMPVGKFEYEAPFSLKELNTNPGDKAYLFSDGYADQFGGVKGKKFKYAQLQKILTENKNLPFEQQKTILDQNMKEWMGNLEQVDDMLVLGLLF